MLPSFWWFCCVGLSSSACFMSCYPLPSDQEWYRIEQFASWADAEAATAIIWAVTSLNPGNVAGKATYSLGCMDRKVSSTGFSQYAFSTDLFVSPACAYKKYKLCLYKVLYSENPALISFKGLGLKSWIDLHKAKLLLLWVWPHKRMHMLILRSNITFAASLPTPNGFH